MGERHESVESLRQIDAICDRFEREWHGQPRMPLDGLLQEIPEECRPRLFKELLALEIELRDLDGEAPAREEYLAKYPQFSGQIAACFVAAHGEPSGSVRPATALPESRAHSAALHPRVDRGAFGQPAETPGGAARFGRFELLAPLGEGGFGTVWKAYDPLLKRLVALKIPRRGQLCPRDTAAVLHEARAAARLRHPAVVQVFEVGEEGDTVYIASEYFDGGSLRDYQADHRMPVEQVAQLGVRLADALHHAHSQGVVHRDLKPSNILLDAALSAWITDFGVARHPDRPEGEADGPCLLGTLAYMPPEQAAGAPHAVDCRADVYSLGVVLFELLTGERPFGGEGEALRRAIQQQPAPSLRGRNRGIPRDIEAICRKCLEKDPARRYRSAEELGAELRRFLRGEPVSARPLWPSTRLWRWCRRKPALAGMTTLIVLLVTAVVTGGVIYSMRTADLLRAARTNLYFHRILAAQQSWQVNDIDYFRSLLDECPEDLRRWEWHYLCGLPRFADKTLELAGGWVVYSPDGTQLATAGCEKAVKLWDARTGKMLFALRGHQSFPSAAAFSPDGGWIASAGGDDRLVIVWDLAHRRLSGLFRGHGGPVVAVRFSPDGSRLVSASLDKTIRVWDVRTRKELRRLQHDGRVWAVDVSPDGTLIASASGKGQASTIQLWDLNSANKVWETPGSGRQADVAFSPDGKRLAVADGLASVRLFDVGLRRQVLVIGTTAGSHPHVAFHPEGRSLAANQWDHSIRIWDSTTGAELRTIRGQTAPVQSIAFSRGAELAFGTTHDFVFVCNTRDEANVVTLRGHRGRVSTLAFSADGSSLASGSEDGVLWLWNPERDGPGEVLARQQSAVRSVAFSPDGAHLAATGEDASVQVWDVEQKRSALVFRGHSRPVQAIAYAPHGSQIASAGRDGTVQVWDPATGQLLHSLAVEERDVRSVAFSPCALRLAVAGRGHQVQIWRMDTEQVEFTCDCEYPAYQVKFHPAGQALAISTSDGAIRFWDFRQGRSHARFSKKGDRSRTTVAYSADGSRLLTASEQDAVRLWDLKHHRQLLTLAEGGNVAGVAAFSPCDRYIAAVWQNDIKVWSTGP